MINERAETENWPWPIEFIALHVAASHDLKVGHVYQIKRHMLRKLGYTSNKSEK